MAAGASPTSKMTEHEKTKARPGATDTADPPDAVPADAGYAQGEFGVKQGDGPPERAAPVEIAASKPTAAPEAVPLPDPPEHDDPSVNPKPGSGG